MFAILFYYSFVQIYEVKALARLYMMLSFDKSKVYDTIDTLRLAVVDTNPTARAYWQTLKCTTTGEIKPYQNRSVLTQATIYSKGITKEALGHHV